MSARARLVVALAPAIAVGRIVEERIRSSDAVRRAARRALYLLARRSSELREYVRIRVRRVV